MDLVHCPAGEEVGPPSRVEEAYALDLGVFEEAWEGDSGENHQG